MTLGDSFNMTTGNVRTSNHIESRLSSTSNIVEFDAARNTISNLESRRSESGRIVKTPRGKMNSTPSDYKASEYRASDCKISERKHYPKMVKVSLDFSTESEDNFAPRPRQYKHNQSPL